MELGEAHPPDLTDAGEARYDGIAGVVDTFDYLSTNAGYPWVAAGTLRRVTVPLDRIQWMLRARPADYLLAMATASASLPVVGKHLEPVGSLAAMGIWGSRHAPDLIAAGLKSCLRPGAGGARREQRDQTHHVSRAGLRGVVPDADLAIDWPAPERTAPFFRRCSTADTCTGPRCATGSPSQLLDVWRRDDLPAHSAPVLIFVPGGAWVHGSRILQGYALMSHLRPAAGCACR